MFLAHIAFYATDVDTDMSVATITIWLINIECLLSAPFMLQEKFRTYIPIKLYFCSNGFVGFKSGKFIVAIRIAKYCSYLKITDVLLV
jgi:hypothetical protein